VRIATGTRLGPYEIVDRLGAGGMGEVYRARDTRLGRSVALKVLPGAVAADRAQIERFEQEARSTAALQHPNILVVHDFGTSGGAPYIVTELLDGETLRERLRAGALPTAEALQLSRQLAAGLAAAHAEAIVHRDLKPENLFVTRDGRLKILDFGLARCQQPQPDSPTLTPTAAGTILGSPGYMAPEQVRGEEADARADVFAFGAVLFEMLSGERAFDGGSFAERSASTLRSDPLQHLHAVDPAIVRLLRRCLEKEPARRYRNGGELAAALESLGGGTPAAAPAAAAIAVFPFADLSAERDQRYFCEGVAEEILTSLARVDGLCVASRSASFRLRPEETGLREAAAAVGVRYALEGSVRRAGDRVRVSVQLVDAESGFQRWSERFDGVASEVFAIQDEIAESVVRTLKGVFGDREREAIGRAARTEVEAYEWYLRGRRAFGSGLMAESAEAIADFREALRIDPGYAPAWAGLADALSWRLFYFGASSRELGELEQASSRAVELAPGLAEARTSRGNALSMLGRPEEAEAEFRLALEAGPRSFEAHYFYGRHLLTSGRVDEAIHEYTFAEGLRPDDYQLSLVMSSWLEARGRADEAREARERGLDLVRRRLAIHPNEVRGLYLGAGALIALGRQELGLEWIERALELAPEDAGVLYNAACTFAVAGERDRALATLERVAEAGFAHRMWVEHDPDWKAVRDDPRFAAALARIDRNRPGSQPD
jgi:TolB-like protein/Flp pilus assembly protein TadD